MRFGAYLCDRLAQLKRLPTARASLPMPFKTSLAPYMKPCAVPQDVRVTPQRMTMHSFFTSSAPRFLSGLKECSSSGKMFCPDGAKLWQVDQLEKPIMGCYG